MANIYTEDQLVSHYRYLTDESKRRITRVISNFCYIEKVENRSSRTVEEIQADEREIQKLKEERKELECSFCGKSQKDLHFLIAGNGSYICDECVRMCMSVLEHPEEFEKGESK